MRVTPNFGLNYAKISFITLASLFCTSCLHVHVHIFTSILLQLLYLDKHSMKVSISVDVVVHCKTLFLEPTNEHLYAAAALTASVTRCGVFSPFGLLFEHLGEFFSYKICPGKR